MDLATRIPTAPRLLIAATLGAALICVLHLEPFHLGGPGLDVAINDWLYNAVLVGGALVCLWRGVAVRANRAVWIALGISLAFWSAGDIYWSAVVQYQHPQPYPSVADFLYLASYPPYYVGVMLFVRARISHAPMSMWMDGAIGGLAMAALAAAALTPALVGLTEGSPSVVATNVAYPLADLTLFLFVVGAWFVMGGRGGREWTLVTAGLLTLGIADSIYLYQVAVGSYQPGTLLDSLWLVNAVVLSIAAWTAPTQAPRGERRGQPLAQVVGFAAIAVGILVFQLFDSVSRVAEALAVAALGVAVARLLLALGENSRLLGVVQREAVTDALTGLHNRRALVDDLQHSLDEMAGNSEPFVFALYDLDGFKTYNDRFGHAAGDVLLRRLGRSLEEELGSSGRAYRLGGDEFCVLIPGPRDDSLLESATVALSESGPGFRIDNSFGAVELPAEAADASTALKLADSRMYASKRGRRLSTERQTRDVLLAAQVEREPRISEHLRGVADDAVLIGRTLGLDGEQLDILRRAAELHDIGKIAIPEAIVDKPGPLDEEEWRLMRRHTLIGERILAAAPAMQPVARVVRSTHERWDGRGYPDGLVADKIPLASRIIFICDAFDAMTRDRPYSNAMSIEEALTEVRGGAGTQFDPELAIRFCEMIEARPVLALA